MNVRFLFRPAQRLKSSGQIDEVFAGRCSVSDGVLILYGLPNTLGHARLGLSVGKKHGNAPQRNRLKRLLRNSFRLAQHELPAWDLLVVPKNAKAIDTDYLKRAWPELANRLLNRFRQMENQRKRQAIPATGPVESSPPAAGEA